ncbi:DUF6693 family protein [uncultured Cohaesibacter sp.]|uniref:DUF6693 family protein n=1 Tax=uncultured Cohaesibacter sp. TaxID=1002546 RepID=UPI0029C7DD97|nr:DUF6693 family protein [uncultured Cohaesibacter sp.]
MSGFKCEFQLVEALGHIVLWIFLSVITLGFAAFLAPYYLTKAPLNQTYLVDRQGVKLARVHVDFNIGQVIGHAVIWLLLTIVTLGLAYFFYWFSVVRQLINASVFLPVGRQDAPAE